MKSNEYRHWHIKFFREKKKKRLIFFLSFFFSSLLFLKNKKKMVALRLSSWIMIHWLDPYYWPLNVCFP